MPHFTLRHSSLGTATALVEEAAAARLRPYIRLHTSAAAGSGYIGSVVWYWGLTVVAIAIARERVARRRG